MWRLPRMGAHVHSQVARVRERLAARLADMRLLPRMGAHVHSQVTGQRERLAARLSLEGAARPPTASPSLFGKLPWPRRRTRPVLCRPAGLRCSSAEYDPSGMYHRSFYNTCGPYMDYYPYGSGIISSPKLLILVMKLYQNHTDSSPDVRIKIR